MGYGKTLAAISVLTGTIMGAGILGIPFVVMKSGFTIGIINITILGMIIALVSLYLGEIILRTKTDHHLVGYAEKYLGKKGKMLMLLTITFGIYSAILAYLIGEGESLSFLLFETNSYNLHLTIIFWFFLSIISYLGLKTLKKGEEINLTLIVILIFSLILVSFNKINFQNLSYNAPENFLAPFGVVLFALLGFSAIPELKKILHNKNIVKTSIISAYTLVIIIYIVFVTIVLGVKGTNTPQIATLTLGKPFILLGILTMFGAYLALTNALINTLKLDYNLSKAKSWFIAISIPLILYIILKLTHSANFIKVLSIGGAISGTLTAILIMIMHHRSKYLYDRKPEYSLPSSKLLSFLLILIFVVGTISEIINSL